MSEPIRFWGPPRLIADAGRRPVEYPSSEQWLLEVSRKGLAELKAERDVFGYEVERDELREAEHEYLEARAAAEGTDYRTAFYRSIAEGKIGQVR
jgi:hypothetical protein